MAVSGEYELLRDPKFRRGFEALNLGGADKDDPGVRRLPCGNPEAVPAWKLAQWETRYDFRDPAVTAASCPAPGVYRYDSGDKVLTVDTVSGTLGMELNASRVYDAPRREGQGWPHLLIEGATASDGAPFAVRLKNGKHLRLTFSQRLTMFRDRMGESANPALHAGSFYIYLYIKGVNEKGNTEMLWFGLTLFDNRFGFDAERGSRDSGKADASGLFIYQVPVRAFRDREAVVGGWIDVDMDVLPFVRRSLILARERGYMQGVTMDTVYIDGINLGWEMPGTYDGKMEIRNLSLKAYVDADYPRPAGAASFLDCQPEECRTVPVDDGCRLIIPERCSDSRDVLTIRCGPAEDTRMPGRAVYSLRAWRNGETWEGAFAVPLEAECGAVSADVKILSDSLWERVPARYDESSRRVHFQIPRPCTFAVETGEEETP